MSTKTTFKRVALVAAVAAAFGGLSTVAANASTASTNATATPTLNSVTTNTSVTQTLTVGAYQSESLTAGTNDSLYTITTTGVGTVYYPTTAPAQTTLSAASATSEIWSNGAGAIGAQAGNGLTGVSGFNNTSYDFLTFSAFSATAGTQTITVTGSASAALTYTITWGAAPAISAANTTYGVAVKTGSVTQGTVATVAQPDAAQTANAYRAATIVVAPADQYGHSLASEALTAIVSGPGTLSFGSADAAGRALTGAASAYQINLFADGTAGTSTVTISDGTVVLATVTAVFSGSTAAVKSVGNLKVLKAGGTAGLNAGNVYSGAVTATDAATVLSSSTTGATTNAGTTPLTAFTFDANGNAAYNSSDVVKAVSSDSTVITGTTCVQAVAGTTTGYTTAPAIGEYNCPIVGAALAASGKSATVTVTVYKDSTLATVIATATPVTYTIGGSIAKVALATDAATYTSGGPVALVATATDSSGNAAFDQDAALFAETLTASTVLGGTAALPGAAVVEVVGGSHTFTGYYAPVFSGPFTISGTDSTSAANVVSASATGSNPTDAVSAAATDAANEATDAANAATDAANAAADAADAATSAAQDASAKADAALAAVNALSAKITVLAAQIAKIVKKLKA